MRHIPQTIGNIVRRFVADTEPSPVAVLAPATDKH